MVLLVSGDPCPDLKNTSPTPQVVADRPKMANAGVILILIGFALQLPAAAMAAFSRNR